MWPHFFYQLKDVIFSVFWSNRADKPEYSIHAQLPMPLNTNCSQNVYEEGQWRSFILHNLRDSEKVVSWMKLEKSFYKATLNDGSVIFFSQGSDGRYQSRFLSSEDAQFKTEKEWLREFARRLNFLMDYSGINQKDLSQMTGISQSSLSFYCCYKRVPSSYTLVQLAEVFGVSVEFLSCFK